MEREGLVVSLVALLASAIYTDIIATISSEFKWPLYGLHNDEVNR
jgi:hypothetical protein